MVMRSLDRRLIVADYEWRMAQLRQEQKDLSSGFWQAVFGVDR